jgi:ribonuclease E
MLINALEPEECRVAIVANGSLDEFYIETAEREQARGNIYKGVIAHMEPSLEAAFVDYGGKRHGFLQLDEIHPEYFDQPQAGEAPERKGKKPRIHEVIQKGKVLLVQVVKEETGQKGAQLTTYLSLPGRTMVLTPGSEQLGISRKIEDEVERKRLKAVMEEITLPAGVGYILRTASEGQSKRDLSRQMSALLRLWESVKEKGIKAEAPSLVYQEMDLAIRSVRDHLSTDMDEILIDQPEVFRRVRDFVNIISPRQARVVKLHKESRPIFSKYQVEDQLETIFSNRVRLKSGGSIVINPTEALVSIDVNSGQATKERQLETTAFKTNLEAAEEVARQLRLRDLGGLIVVDFIDMRDHKHQGEVLKAFKQFLKTDRARTTLGRISKFGLLELSRQKVRPPIEFGTYHLCPLCGGRGMVKSVEATAVAFLRRIGAALSKGGVETVRGILPMEVAGYLLNRKRAELLRLEMESGAAIALEGRPGLSVQDMELVVKKREQTKEEPVPEFAPAPEAAEARPAGKSRGRHGRKKRPRSRGKTEVSAPKETPETKEPIGEPAGESPDKPVVESPRESQGESPKESVIEPLGKSPDKPKAESPGESSEVPWIE